MTEFKVSNLCAAYGRKHVFSGINFRLQKGEVVALLGPNGCGKTTLLRTLLALHPKTEGEIWFAGKSIDDLSVKQRARMVSYVPQYHKMAFAYPVLEMVLMAIYGDKAPWLHASQDEIAHAMSALEWMGIAELAHRPYTELSGGQRQMVLIARAYAQNTPLIMMDEPTNGLDYGNQIKLLQKINALMETGKTVLMTTHHPEHALQCSSRAITMKDGHLLSDGCPLDVLKDEKIRSLYELSHDDFYAYRKQA
nr:ABC transporter ATP-binding protein [Thiomicrorhabdus marina]